MTSIRILSPVSLDAWNWLPARRLLAHLLRPLAMEASGARVRSAAVSRRTTTGDIADRFHQTIVPHLDASYNFARFLSRDAEAAEDIVQEAFLRAYRHFDGYRGGDPRAWLFSIVRNCYRAWRQEGRRKAHYELPIADERDDDQPAAHAIASDEDTPEMAMIHKSDAERVRAVIRGLPEAMREILVLRELEDLSYRQIAEIIGVPIGTVMSRLARARREFSEAWQAIEGAQS